MVITRVSKTLILGSNPSARATRQSPLRFRGGRSASPLQLGGVPLYPVKHILDGDPAEKVAAAQGRILVPLPSILNQCSCPQS